MPAFRSDTSVVERDTARPSHDTARPLHETHRPAHDGVSSPPTPGVAYVWSLARLSLGWVFLWAFLDKTLGLGVATERGDAWLNGGSPTSGFLTHGTKGPLAGLFQGLAGVGWVDALFMAGLLGLAVALVLGIALRLAAVAGTVLLGLIWAAGLWPENNPFMDQHIVYALVLVGLALAQAGDTWGLGRWWRKRGLVRRLPALR